jgi:hypothetical protein
VEHSLEVFDFALGQLSTLYMAYWADPVGFADVRACVEIGAMHACAHRHSRARRRLGAQLHRLRGFLGSHMLQQLRAQVRACTGRPAACMLLRACCRVHLAHWRYHHAVLHFPAPFDIRTSAHLHICTSAHLRDTKLPAFRTPL